jgi:hypothetical protein
LLLSQCSSVIDLGRFSMETSSLLEQFSTDTGQPLNRGRTRGCRYVEFGQVGRNHGETY